MLIDKTEITRFIPQRTPFVMIDEVITATEKGFTTRFTIAENNIFLENGKLSESALIENIAQTCAAGFGYVNSQKGEGEGQLGFIGAISKLTNTKSAQLNDTIETNVEILNTFDNIHLIQGKAELNNEVLLECQMKIVIA